MFVTSEAIAPWTRIAARADIAPRRRGPASIRLAKSRCRTTTLVRIPIIAIRHRTCASTIRTARRSTPGLQRRPSVQHTIPAPTTRRTTAGSAPSSFAAHRDFGDESFATRASAAACATTSSRTSTTGRLLISGPTSPRLPFRRRDGPHDGMRTSARDLERKLRLTVEPPIRCGASGLRLVTEDRARLVEHRRELLLRRRSAQQE